MRRKPEERENHDRWLVSYSDFLTLLLALFVVMYAISQVNEGKYKVVAGSLVTAFGNQPNQLNRQSITTVTPDSLPIRDPVKRPIDRSAGDSMGDYLIAKKARRIAEAQRRQQEKMEIIARDVIAAFDPLLRNGQVRVVQSDLGVRVEIDASLAIRSGRCEATGRVQQSAGIGRAGIEKHGPRNPGGRAHRQYSHRNRKVSLQLGIVCGARQQRRTLAHRQRIGGDTAYSGRLWGESPA